MYGHIKPKKRNKKIKNLYQITKEDKKKINQKLKSQKEFLNSFMFEAGDKTMSLLDSCYSANLNSKKYFAEMNNRVNSIFQYTQELGLKPAFITLTAPGMYHKLNKNGTLKISPSDTAKELSQIWAKFLRLKIFKRMKDDTGHGLIYFRVYEPHQSGVPHIHAMIFIPADYILEVKKRFYDYFKDFGTNEKAMDFKYNFYNKDKNGNVTGGAIAYIMKYITKTFVNESDNTKVDNVVYWYVKYRIRRFLSSRTLAPLLLYRKIRFNFLHLEDDSYLHVSEQYKKGIITRFFNDTQFTQYFVNPDTGEVEEKILYSKSIQTDEPTPASVKSFLKYFALKLKRNFDKEYLSNHFHALMPNYYTNYINDDLEDDEEDMLFDIINNYHFTNKHILHQEKEPEFKKVLKVLHNGVETHFYCESEKRFKHTRKTPAQLKDYELIRYFKELDKRSFENDSDLKHYGVVKNECIKRELIKGVICSINDYNFDFNCEVENV
jgi:hypothetical protein